MGECCFFQSRFNDAKEYYLEAILLIDQQAGKQETESQKEPLNVMRYASVKNFLTKRITDCEMMLSEANPIPDDIHITKPPPSESKINLPSEEPEERFRIDSDYDMITDNENQIKYKAFESNPISLIRYRMNVQDSSWTIPSEKELRTLILTLIQNGLISQSFFKHFLRDDSETAPFLTSDSHFDQGTEQYHCLKIHGSEVTVCLRERIEAVNLILRKKLGKNE
jgi:hypothetical protein